MPARVISNVLALFVLGGHARSRSAPVSTYSVACENRKCEFFQGKVRNATAWASYEDTINDTGWASLHLHSNPVQDPMDQAFGAGYLESALTADRTWQHRQSMFDATFTGLDDKDYILASNFLSANDEFVLTQIKQHSGNSSGSGDQEELFWFNVALVWAQLDGMVAGYSAFAPSSQALSRLDFLFVNALVDISSLIHKPFASGEWSVERLALFRAQNTHCSAIVRVTPDNGELLTSHNTWTGYYTMLRLLKEYDLPYRTKTMAGGGAVVPGAKAVFPGYFGTLSSLDDFFVLSSGLVVQETTNAVTNSSLLERITPSSVLTWVRTLVANRLATDGPTWAELFKRHNSGTINNQWMVVDYNKFTPGQPLPDGTLTILEQLPGWTRTADVTALLRLGYWPSYNQPYFEDGRALSGADEMEKQFGPSYSYSLDPRAKIFRRDAPKVNSLEDLKRLQRYNQWQKDPFAAEGYGGAGEPRSPENQIASRYDLIPPRENQTDPQLRGAFGNTDAKVVSSSQVKQMTFDCVSGPTNDDQPAFAYVGEYASSPHHGQPTSWTFQWVSFSEEK